MAAVAARDGKIPIYTVGVGSDVLPKSIRVADIVAILSTLDVVIPCIDR